VKGEVLDYMPVISVIADISHKPRIWLIFCVMSLMSSVLYSSRMSSENDHKKLTSLALSHEVHISICEGRTDRSFLTLFNGAF
jgi:hypothetical protein